LADLQIVSTYNKKVKLELRELLESHGLSSLLNLFTKEQIDYETFLQLTENDLKDLEVPIGPRKKTLQLIQNLKKNKSSSSEVSRMYGWPWTETQSRLCIPKEIPVKNVESIPFSRLIDVKYQRNFGDFLAMYFRYFGYAYIKLTDQMFDMIKEFKELWNGFFDMSQEEKEASSLARIMSGAYGGYYDEDDRQMFHIAPMMLGCTPPWPANKPQYQLKALETFRMLENLGKICLTALARSIGIDPQLFLQSCEIEYAPRLLGSSCRVCRYKKQEQNTGVICPEHTDTTIISIGPISTVPELQFF